MNTHQPSALTQVGVVRGRAVSSDCSAAVLLDRLDGVHRSAPNRWRAICPAHESRHRTKSLSIRELSDGTLLVRCHAGCNVDQIVAAVGLELRDLFPHEPITTAGLRHPRSVNRWRTLRETVKVLHHECLVCAIAAEDVATGRPITREDAIRVAQCAGRIRAAIEACT